MLSACSVVHANLQRSVASVQWIGIHKKNQYRVGHRGKVHMLLACVATCSVGATWQLVSSKVQYALLPLTLITRAPTLITF